MNNTSAVTTKDEPTKEDVLSVIKHGLTCLSAVAIAYIITKHRNSLSIQTPQVNVALGYIPNTVKLPALQN